MIYIVRWNYGRNRITGYCQVVPRISVSYGRLLSKWIGVVVPIWLAFKLYAFEPLKYGSNRH